MLKDLPSLEEDVDEENVFVMSGTENQKRGKRLPPVGSIEIDGTTVLTLIDTGATVNVMDITMLDGLSTHPVVRQTNIRLYPYGCTMPLDIRGVVDVTVRSGAKQIQMTFH